MSTQQTRGSVARDVDVAVVSADANPRRRVRFSRKPSAQEIKRPRPHSRHHSRDGPCTVGMMARDTVGLIKHLGLSRVRIAGISLGGFITFQVARSRPDLVRAAVCIAGLVGGSRYVQILTDARVDALRQGRDMPATLDSLLSLPGTFAPATLQNDAVVEAMTTMMGTVLGEWAGPGRRGQYEADTDWIRRSAPWQEQALAETTVPVLVVAHEFDLFFPPALLAWGAERLPAGQFLEISGCGHAGVEDIGAHRDAALKFFASV